MEESIAGGRGETNAVGPSPKAATATVPPPAARAPRETGQDGESGGADGATDDNAGLTAESAVVTDTSDSTQIRSFFENLLQGSS